MDRRVEFNVQDEVFIVPPRQSPMSEFLMPFGDTFMLDGVPGSDMKHCDDEPSLPLGSTFALFGDHPDVSTEALLPGSVQELFPVGDTFTLDYDTGDTFALGSLEDECLTGDTFPMNSGGDMCQTQSMSIPEADTLTAESTLGSPLPLGVSFDLHEESRFIRFQDLNMSSDEQSGDSVPMGDVFSLHGDTPETPIPHDPEMTTSPDPIGQLIHRNARTNRQARSESLLDLVTESGRRAREIVIQAGVDVRGADPIAFTLLGEYMDGHGWAVETAKTSDDREGIHEAIITSFRRINDRAQHHRLLLKYDILLLEMLDKVQKHLV